jgi:hypothetical protein
MSGESPKKTGRGYARNLEAGPFQPMIDSWDLHLRAERKSAKTIRTYLEAAQWFAAGYLIPGGFTGWDEVRARQVPGWPTPSRGKGRCKPSPAHPGAAAQRDDRRRVEGRGRSGCAVNGARPSTQDGWSGDRQNGAASSPAPRKPLPTGRREG